jgi:signal transduction histidine kinase
MKVQESSANILTFIVQDLLDYAQIKSGTFRKNPCEFNIKEAVEEVMLIQKRKAADNNIEFHASYEGFDSLNINSDKQRV